jgi:hypothetical protein
MKRIFTTAVAAAALVCALPATALAHHHHARGKHHAHKARVLMFGSVRTASSAPSTPTPQTPSGTTGGKVVSFENGVLTIAFTEGGTFTGKVTNETELLCQSETTSSGNDDQDEANDEGSSSSGENSSSTIGQSVRDNGDWFGSPGQGQGDGQGQGSGEGNSQSQEGCTTALLVKEAVVLGAELKLGNGAVWEKVILQH